MPSPSLKAPTQAVPWRYSECAVKDCGREPRTWSRYCTIHARRFYETRDPNGRTFRPRELKPFREMADDWLTRKADHPAVIAAIEYMEALLTSPALAPALRQQMERLRLSGAEPRAMLVNALAVWGLIHFHPNSHGTDACATQNLGRRVLLTAPMPRVKSRNGKAYSMHLRARTCEAMGQVLRDSIGVFMIQFWNLVETAYEAPRETTASLRKILESDPLGPLTR